MSIKYCVNSDTFSNIPGSPVAYWASPSVVEAYKFPNLDAIAQSRHGLATSDNERFLRLWHEINVNRSSVMNRDSRDKKWYPMNKGGSYRKWYGNLEWLINYENDGDEIKTFAISIYRCSSRTIQNTQFYFKESLTWSALASGNFSVRWSEKGAVFGSGGYCAFTNKKIEKYILALMNNRVTSLLIQFVSPTLNYEVGHIKTIPVIIDEEQHGIIDEVVTDCIDVSKRDWDSFETSWDFKKHPLI